ncbi:MAG: PQQ-binding-like beta-propeller repeat protein [Chloroflexota bacterium]
MLVAPLLISPGQSSLTPRVALAAVGVGWPTYHRDNTRSGYDGSTTFNSRRTGDDWTRNNLDAEVFASPVTWNGMVYVATENDTVYALDEIAGTTVWSRTVAAAIPGTSTYIGCSPAQFGAHNGITGTPAVDPATGNVFVVGTVDLGSGNAKYSLFALNGSTGAVLFSRDLPGPVVRYQNQRGALAVANGRVYVPFGGRAGDCGTYHPYVIAVPTGDGTPITYQGQTGTQNEAGIWAPSGESIDASGNVYVETGNGSYLHATPCDNTQWDHGDAVVKLSPALAELDFFAPYDWCALNASDTDLGSVAPVLVGGSLVGSGKSGSAWVASQSSLGHFGGPATASGASGIHIPNCSSVFGGMAALGTVAYLPCSSRGIVALNVNSATNSWTVAWDSAAANPGVTFNPGAPILAGGALWVEAQGGSSLYSFDPTTGAQKFPAISLASSASRFTTLAADGNRLFAMLHHGVQSIAFNTPSTFTVTNTAYLSWFDRLSDSGFAGDNVHVVNPGIAPVLVNVRIPGLPGCNYLGDSIGGGTATFYGCPTGFGGPVVVESSARVIASQRVQYNQSFNEVSALPATAATDLYVAWYDRISDPNFTQDNIHVVNPGSITANVTVTIPGQPGCAPSGPVAPGAVGVFKCDTGFGGPVHIHADSGVLASARVKYGATFNEVLAQPSATAMRLMSAWFDHASSPLFHADNIHVLVTSGTLSADQVTGIAVPGCASPTPAQVSPAELVYSCPFGQGFGGPVVVQANVPVLVSLRVQYGSSFNEVLAQASTAAGATLWMSWYDHASSTGFVADNVHVVAATAASLASSQVVITIPGCSPSVIQASPTELYYSCPFGSGFGGPVKVTSTVTGGVMVSQRVQYYASFNEAVAST